MKKRRIYKLASVILALLLFVSCASQGAGVTSSAVTKKENQSTIVSSETSKDETSSLPAISSKPSKDESSSQKDNSSVTSKEENGPGMTAPADKEHPFSSEVDSIYHSIYFIEGKEYGRIIASSESREDAVRVATRHFTDKRHPQSIDTVAECQVIYESDILYGINVKWKVTNYGEPDGQYEENVISFKKSVADITVKNVNHGDVASYKICTDKDEEITQIVLRLCHDKYLMHMYEYETSSNGDEYTITTRYYETHYGDWGIKDTYTFYKQIIVVNKLNDSVDFQEPKRTGKIL